MLTAWRLRESVAGGREFAPYPTSGGFLPKKAWLPKTYQAEGRQSTLLKTSEGRENAVAAQSAVDGRMQPCCGLPRAVDGTAEMQSPSEACPPTLYTGSPGTQRRVLSFPEGQERTERTGAPWRGCHAAQESADVHPC